MERKIKVKKNGEDEKRTKKITDYKENMWNLDKKT